MFLAYRPTVHAFSASISGPAVCGDRLELAASVPSLTPVQDSKNLTGR
ncbi:hypothetical protein [Streptomyces sp. SID2888]|nr:hypothetical protein [Streptomyces sp. SID2888]MYV49894.1 hypothetical protein [Streptomyces sp. SID2888]